MNKRILAKGGCVVEPLLAPLAGGKSGRDLCGAGRGAHRRGHGREHGHLLRRRAGAHALAEELGYDAGFGAGTYADDVITFAEKELARRMGRK